VVHGAEHGRGQSVRGRLDVLWRGVQRRMLPFRRVNISWRFGERRAPGQGARSREAAGLIGPGAARSLPTEESRGPCPFVGGAGGAGLLVGASPRQPG
jgi:hypothetical protein